jgi:hypothetical protein
MMPQTGKIAKSIDSALSSGLLGEPFSSDDFKKACPGFGAGTYNAFLWKHRQGNPGGESELFEQVGPNQFKRIRRS